MNLISHPLLAEFLQDLHIQPDEQTSVIQSKVMFLSGGVPNYYDCKIKIVPEPDKKREFIYLVNKEINEDGFEDVYQIQPGNAEYMKYVGFVVKEAGKPALYILPKFDRKKKDLSASITSGDKMIEEHRSISFLKDAKDPRRMIVNS